MTNGTMDGNMTESGFNNMTNATMDGNITATGPGIE